ncbi:hypothetical protein [Polymorphobacter megasporae]|nr:hypothetical protein [Polymorphobacter megasporae]
MRADVKAGGFDKKLANKDHGDAEVQIPKRTHFETVDRLLF